MEKELIELFNSLSEEDQQKYLEYLMRLIPDEEDEPSLYQALPDKYLRS